MTKDCTKHDTYDKRKHLEFIMESIRENQGGKGRHKCPYCAYELGFEAGIEHAAGRLRDIIQTETRRSATKAD